MMFENLNDIEQRLMELVKRYNALHEKHKALLKLQQNSAADDISMRNVRAQLERDRAELSSKLTSEKESHQQTLTENAKLKAALEQMKSNMKKVEDRIARLLSQIEKEPITTAAPKKQNPDLNESQILNQSQVIEQVPAKNTFHSDPSAVLDREMASSKNEVHNIATDNSEADNDIVDKFSSILNKVVEDESKLSTSIDSPVKTPASRGINMAFSAPKFTLPK